MSDPPQRGGGPSTPFLVALMLCFAALIPLGDAAGKLLAQDGVSPLFVAWSRFLIGALMLTPFLQLTRPELAHMRDLRLYVRAGAVVGGISLILFAAQTEPLANVFGAFFIAPIIAYMLAVVWLGEGFSVARSLLLALGFGGVLMVVKPGIGLSTGMGFALASGCCYGCFLAASRWLATEFRAGFLLFTQLVFGAVVLAPSGLAHLPDPTPKVIALVLISALASGVANWLLVYVSGHLQARIIAPLIYTQLIGATIYGLVFFGDWPDRIALLGLGVILISGLAALMLRAPVAASNTQD